MTTRDAILKSRSKPNRLPVHFDNIPYELKTLNRWLGWRWEWDAESNKWTKVPISARTGRKGSSTDPKTWSTFEQVRGAYKQGKVDGVGIALGDIGDWRVMAGIDIDGCRNPETGELSAISWAIIELIGSYAEVSPTGTGIKIFCFGRLPTGKRQSACGQFECYDSGRYFTVTGHIVEGAPRTLRDATAKLAQFHEAIMAESSSSSANTQERCGQSDRDTAIEALKYLNGSRADNRFDWIRVGMALKATDESLLPKWIEWSRQSNKFVSAADCEKTWRSFKRSGVSIGSLIHWARQDGWSGPQRKGQAPTPQGGPSRDGSGNGSGLERTRRLTDIANGERFAQQHSGSVRYCYKWGKWLAYDGKRWSLDSAAEIAFRRAPSHAARPGFTPAVT